MLPGPDRIVACPHCGALARHATLAPGGGLRATVWTDGLEEAPMLPQPPAVLRCARCARFYWLADAEPVGVLAAGAPDADPAWAAATPVRELSEAEHYLALEQGLARDGVEERALRILAWWRRNDPYRAWDGTAPQQQGDAWPPRPVSDACRRNLLALAYGLDPHDPHALLMKAEAFRELGRFGDAKAVLADVGHSFHGRLVAQLHRLCDAGDTCVRRAELFG